ncbi:unnamed protein product [Ceutorhynchus assimilis]|uniref:Uncharacterized protein n=1 Tax=Ceutorhynchus assimilis TaxID=467358 RepID=A0A9N9MHL0_9CUCU|nr:unnamed protein product [Ceutorhynchus assimilis]
MLSVQNSLEPKIINNVPLNNDTTIEKLTVNGSITFKQNLNVKNSINNIKISNKTLLLKSGNQNFAGNLTLPNLKAQNLNTNQITKLKTLKVKDLVIGGYLNRVSIPVLVKRALKKSGNQIMEKPFSCDALEVDSFNVDGVISGKKVPDDFVMINSGEYVVGQDVQFLKDLKTNKFEILSSLNNISVTDDGTLDILLTESPYVQYIPTRKTFENIIITNPINLLYKIRNAKIQQYNPVTIDDNSYKINTDVTINGPGKVTGWLKAQDLKPKDAQRSFGAILDKGLKLSDTQISVHLNFTEPLNLNHTKTDKVNSLNPLEWLLQASNTTQIVKGSKTFLNNVHLNGQMNASRINDVDLHALKHEVLKIAGDQEIFGNWNLNRVVAEKG